MQRQFSSFHFRAHFREWGSLITTWTHWAQKYLFSTVYVYCKYMIHCVLDCHGQCWCKLLIGISNIFGCRLYIEGATNCVSSNPKPCLILTGSNIVGCYLGMIVNTVQPLQVNGPPLPPLDHGLLHVPTSLSHPLTTTWS